MLRYAVLVALGLVGCSGSDAGEPAATASVQEWRFASGKAPSHTEYAAFVATCRDGAVQRAPARPLDDCLADLGMRRVNLD
ncbi:MAG TPA: hypothetical protein VHY35_06125 [Stellaceae bacterium]|jgi:hypothetical protein|nr:hypothetical protein [Stellaceae bacterium]